MARALEACRQEVVWMLLKRESGHFPRGWDDAAKELQSISNKRGRKYGKRGSWLSAQEGPHLLPKRPRPCSGRAPSALELVDPLVGGYLRLLVGGVQGSYSENSGALVKITKALLRENRRSSLL